MPGRRRDSSNTAKIIVILLVVFMFAVIIFLVVDRNRRTDPFIQGVVGLILGLIITLVLFTLTYAAKANILLAGGVSASGAAAFLLLLLPKIMPFIFPFYSFSGIVAFESASESSTGFTGVKGALVQVMGNTNLAATTDENGNFTIANVPSQVDVTRLIIISGGESYDIDIQKFPDKIYRIPRPPQVIRSERRSIQPGWVEIPGGECKPTSYRGDDCLLRGEASYESMKQFVLEQSVPMEAGYKKLYLRISRQGEVDILDVRKEAPGSGAQIQDESGYCQSRQWAFDVSGQEVKVKLAVCVGSVNKANLISPTNLHATYWFEKVQ